MTNTENLGEVFVHVDNGGFAFKLTPVKDNDRTIGANIVLSHEFYGYVTNVTTLTAGMYADPISADTLDKIGRMFMEAATKIRIANP